VRTPGAYDPHAEAPRFQQFLREIFEGDEELVRFVQRLAGYTLTGSTRERCFAILWGRGRNGKSSLVEVLNHVMGNYANTTDVETILTKRYAGVGNDVAALKGARFVSAAEVEAGRQLAEAKIKNLTGSDTVSCRFLFGEPFKYRPQFKLWLSTNNKPEVKGADDAIWDRIKLIPFRVRFEGKNQDTNLPAKLQKERDGILTWMVAGCMGWQENGLGSAEAVTEATEGYREEMDEMGEFLASRCVIREGATDIFKDVYEDYIQWASREGVDDLSRRSFSKALTDRGLTTKRGTDNKVVVTGLILAKNTVSTPGGEVDKDVFDD
jgi:putative DNA primase/helicase